LIERIAALFDGPSIPQFRFLPDYSDGQSDEDGSWNQNRGKQKKDPPLAPAGIGYVHRAILDRGVYGDCHENVQEHGFRELNHRPACGVYCLCSPFSGSYSWSRDFRVFPFVGQSRAWSFEPALRQPVPRRNWRMPGLN
jgi:hypothetical protein